jgi:predicted DNA-binding antitoxin AbrB/MazE fold protein
MMIEHIRAIYREGAFHPVVPCSIPEEAEVDLVVEARVSSASAPPLASERAQLLKQLTERMRNNPLPASAPRFSREQLHERR